MEVASPAENVPEHNAPHNNFCGQGDNPNYRTPSQYEVKVRNFGESEDDCSSRFICVDLVFLWRTPATF